MKNLIIDDSTLISICITKLQANAVYTPFNLPMAYFPETIEIIDLMQLIKLNKIDYSMKQLYSYMQANQIIPLYSPKQYLKQFFDKCHSQIAICSSKYHIEQLKQTLSAIMDIKGIVITIDDKYAHLKNTESCLISKDMSRIQEARSLKYLSIWIGNTDLELYTPSQYICTNLGQIHAVLDHHNLIEKRYTMGYYFGNKEIEMTNLQVLLCSKYIITVPLFLKCPLDKQGPFDIIIHKATPLMARRLQDPFRQLDILENYVRKISKNAFIMDYPINLDIVIDRNALATKLDNAFQSPEAIEVMKKHYGCTVHY